MPSSHWCISDGVGFENASQCATLAKVSIKTSLEIRFLKYIGLDNPLAFRKRLPTFQLVIHISVLSLYLRFAVYVCVCVQVFWGVVKKIAKFSAQSVRGV